MTKEEAVEVLENGKWWELLVPVTTIEGRIEEGKLHEAIDMAISALQGSTREQVETVWRGEWIDCSNGWMCSRCEHDNTYAKPFCPNCGAPMTDKALEITMKRLEELRND